MSDIKIKNSICLLFLIAKSIKSSFEKLKHVFSQKTSLSKKETSIYLFKIFYIELISPYYQLSGYYRRH